MHRINRLFKNHLQVITVFASLFFFAISLHAQNIGWEGETGIFVTPLAYTAKSPRSGLGRPLVGFHYLNGGGVLGDFYNVSGIVGAFSRVEFGYTRALHTEGGDPNFGPL